MITIPDQIKDFLKIFNKNGFKIYIVGGAIRDLLFNKLVDNWDFATDATPEQIQKLFPDSFYNNIYGTVTVRALRAMPQQNLLFEITPFRKESEYTDLRHPEKIEWAKTIEEDLSRRDFTINAIAFRQVYPERSRRTQGKLTYELVDPFGGQKHLKEKLIVAVGDPDKRFNEDALRLLRAIRFTSQLGFLIEDNTRNSIQKNASLITKISWERIRDEFLKILESDHPAEGIFFLKNTGLLTYILPEVDICFTIPQKSPKRHHVYDVGTHLVMALKHCPSKDPITRFATLIHDIGKAKTF
ncbi:MAG: CCA tRNA nucleotidyltransferase, partial [Candidatus Roizmanbacteria bacterium]|nr:CCA tRNA nucleotidyltransferase [Candidatus Roizmanbacteria bacterium]